MVGAQDLPFAIVTAKVLRRLGGIYGELASRLERQVQQLTTHVQRRVDPNTAGASELSGGGS